MTTDSSLPSRLRILHLEDSEPDAELIANELRREWPACEIVHVKSSAAFAEALACRPFDVILSDFSLGGFDGFEALAMARESHPETPFIVVSGTIGEERAVAALHGGAIDYVLKDRPARLVPAVQRALHEMAQVRSRRAVESAMRESEERFRQLAESSSDVFWFADLEPLRVRYVSPAVEQVWGRKAEDFYAEAGAWLAGVHPDDRARVAQNFNAWLAGDRLSFAEEYRVVRPDGSVRWVYDTGTFTMDAANRTKRLSGVVRDVTLIKEANEQSLRTQRLESIGLLAGGIAHDLNNALAPILMGLELVRADVPAHSVPLFDQMRKSADRGAAMVRQLLGFARGAEGQRAIVEPGRALREVEQLAASTFPKAIALKLRCAADTVKIDVDPTLLHQVLFNLCLNARDAMPGGGTLTLEAANALIDESYAGFIPDAKPGAYVVFTVTDTGTGIPADVLPKIFDPFFTTKPQGVGTGLGLTTVAGIAHNHGGFVRVYSEAGRGTSFKVFFPAMIGRGPVSVAPQDRTPAFQAHGESVLVVDDEESVRVLLKGLLERIGFQVIVMSDGTEALAAFAGRPDAIQLVITDERMPHMDGLTLVRTLRHMKPDLRIIAMSGLHGEVRTREFAALGVTHILHKPFAFNELTEALRACFQVEASQSAPR